jgi:uncharacterized protein YbjT (DUF2867 family)
VKVSVPSFEDEARFSAHKNAIDAAKAAGVKHIYYTSLAIASTSKAGKSKGDEEWVGREVGIEKIYLISF